MVTLYKFIYHLIFSFTFCCITLACFLCRTLVGCLLETSLYVTAHKKVPITTHAFTINHGTENCWITQWYMTWYFWKYALYMYYWKIMCKQHSVWNCDQHTINDHCPFCCYYELTKFRFSLIDDDDEKWLEIQKGNSDVGFRS